MALQLGYGGNAIPNSPDIESSSSPYSRHPYPHPLFSDRSQSITSPTSSAFHQVLDTPRTEFSSTFMTTNGSGFFDTMKSGESSSRSITSPMDPPVLPGLPLCEGSQSRLASVSTVSFEANTLSKNRSAPVTGQPAKGKSKWRKLAVSRKESIKTAGDSSSSSPMTLEAQKLEEVSLRDLMNISKSSFKSKNSKNINVGLSQNSSYALFWTQSTVSVWDIGTSPPILGRSVSPESICVLASVYI